MVQQNNLRAEYLENGYIVIKSLYSPDYIANLRDKMIYDNITTYIIKYFNNIRNHG